MDNVIAKHMIEIKGFLQKKAPNIIGSEAVIMYKENFQKESFFGEKWQDVQRRTGYVRTITSKSGKTKQYKVPPQKGAAGKRKILTGTGNLGRSIRYKVTDYRIIIYSDVPYSDVHNSGLTAGKSGFTMPQRQFIGDSQQIRKMIENVITNGINNITKNG